MTIEDLNELDTLSITEEFGDHIAEEVARSENVLALLDLRKLIELRLQELNQ
ncbi:MAG: hypothetical protein Kow00121_30390 [Elainellaceae cyanobacterium]